MTHIVKERPLLMCGQMVRATLEGRKWHTRRVLKPQPPQLAGDIEESDKHAGEFFYWLDGSEKSTSFLCPYGKPGDRLWVRESFGYYNTGRYDRPERGVFYRATDNPGDLVRWWKPSIHMPRALCRLTLEIVTIRVERVQDISEEDAIAEGVTPLVVPVASYGIKDFKMPPIHRHAFQSLWDGINGKRPGCAWADNPWVWVIEFRKVVE